MSDGQDDKVIENKPEEEARREAAEPIVEVTVDPPQVEHPPVTGDGEQQPEDTATQPVEGENNQQDESRPPETSREDPVEETEDTAQETEVLAEPEPPVEVEEVVEAPPPPKKKKGDQKPVIDAEFFYDYESLVFKPLIAPETEIKENLLELFHSFGYDCKKRSNLYLLDAEHLIFSAGNFVQILNMKTKEQRYLKTLSGGAVGAITVHPSHKYFAVGEKGNQPNINIFEYPSLKLYRMLRSGTVKGYAHLDYDPSGNLLASLGSAPDYMLTIWDWKQENIVLRTKAFAQDIFRVSFSKDLKGVLTSGGIGHIKFWKMAQTFTGYKLQGDIGRFGKTEISDIEGYAELPDGKVLSGSEWGNMLLWDDGLIQTEICRKKGKPCHQGSIQQIILNEGDIYTVGEDGYIRVWDFETIDTAEPSEDMAKLELEPLNELKVSQSGVGPVALRSMVKDFTMNQEDSTIWYAQDSNGGIWKLDLGFSAGSENPRQMFTYHSGAIRGIECCPLNNLLATTADDGSVRVYKYASFDILTQKKFNSSGTCLRWLPAQIDPEGGTILAGFDDGVIRFLKLVPKTNNSGDVLYNLVMFEVFKPHTKAVTHVVIDSKNSLIATSSDDKTVFFFSNQNNTRTPLGFVNLPDEVTYMTWTPADLPNNRLLVCMKNGMVHEYEAPVSTGGSYDTTKTYLIEAKLSCRKLTFTSIKSRLRHEEELERKRKEEEERKKREAEERRLKGLDDEEDEKKKKKEEKKKEGNEEGEEGGDENKKEGQEEAEADGDDKQVKKEDEWKPFIPEVPSKICWAAYSSEDTFWLSMDDYDAGYLYECRFFDDAAKAKMTPEKIGEAVRTVPVERSDLTHSDDVPLSCMLYNKKKNFMIIGQKNGAIRVQQMTESKLIEESTQYWSYGFHDNEYGHISNICFSHDEKFIFSAGSDSNIFGLFFNSTQKDLEEARKQPVTIACKKEPANNVVDIDDTTAYSLEQAKQKSENDKMIAVAEAKKQDMRQKISELRKMFKDLTVRNEQLVPRCRLSKNEFMLEESIKQQVLNQITDKINLTYKELAWNAEKNSLLLEKVKSKFADVIDCGFIVLHDFKNSYTVTSFRTVSLPKDMDQYKSELERLYHGKLSDQQKGAKDGQESQGAKGAQNKSTELKLDGLSVEEQMKKMFGKVKGNTAMQIERALRKMEEKKLKRLRRRREWEELFNSKLPDDYENPSDVASIKYAEDTIGDFKLKSSNDYVVPEGQRMNVFKAVERLMQIKRFIHDNQMIFNKRLLHLREKKKGLIEEINRGVDRIDQIDLVLGEKPEKTFPKYSLRPEEQPEKKYEYTREMILEFKKELETKVTSSQGNEEGSFGSSAPSKPVTVASTDQSQASSASVKQLWSSKSTTMTPLAEQIAKKKELSLKFEKKKIIETIAEKIKLFDAELKLLGHDKNRIGVYMKNADLRHVTIYEEFMLLRDFEKTENELESKLSSKQADHAEQQAKLTDVQHRIEAKRKEVEKVEENLKHLLNHQLPLLIHDETKYGDFLTKVYKRKIKRRKKGEGDEEEDDEEEEEEEESDEDDMDMDDEDEDSENEAKEQLDLDICPSNLRQELYDQVIELREKRLDLEDVLTEERKLLDQMRKDLDSFNKKSKIAENNFKQAQQDLENFQKEKQKKINNLDVVVILRLNQIQYLNKNQIMPADLSETLAFDSSNLEKLETRIKELQIEKASEKKLFKQLRQHHHELIRDKKKMDEYVSKLDDLCNKMMTDKFGKLVDIEKLELIAVNQQIEELKQRLAENEFKHEKVMQEWLNKIDNEKDESIDLIKANTQRLNEMVDIMNETKSIEKALDNKQQSLGEEMTSSTKKDIEERQRLHTLVQLQAQEIEALKAEIAILSRKGGHILPPTQPQTIAQIQN